MADFPKFTAIFVYFFVECSREKPTFEIGDPFDCSSTEIHAYFDCLLIFISLSPPQTRKPNPNLNRRASIRMWAPST